MKTKQIIIILILVIVYSCNYKQNSDFNISYLQYKSWNSNTIDKITGCYSKINESYDVGIVKGDSILLSPKKEIEYSLNFRKNLLISLKEHNFKPIEILRIVELYYPTKNRINYIVFINNQKASLYRFEIINNQNKLVEYVANYNDSILDYNHKKEKECDISFKSYLNFFRFITSIYFDGEEFHYETKEIFIN